MDDNTRRAYAAVLKKGEKLYFGGLKERLEAAHMGEYVAIDVETGKYLTNPNKLQLILRTQKEFPDRHFFTVQIGDVQEPTSNYRNRQHAAWLFA